MMRKAEKELNANELLIIKKEKQRKQEELAHKAKNFFICFFVVAFFVGGSGYLVSRFVQNQVDDVQYMKMLNRTTLEISQLVDNIRNVYLLYPDEPPQNIDKLIEAGAVPETLVQNDGNGKYLKNPFGGRIVIEPSEPVGNKDNTVFSPTFKMSYQGLSRRACIDLAVMDWGDNVKGLVAMAVGNVDEMTGTDSALQEIDKDNSMNEKGRLRRMRYQMNVAKPNDKFMPAPFSRGNAETGCFCSENGCSFALRYAVFSIEQPK